MKVSEPKIDKLYLSPKKAPWFYIGMALFLAAFFTVSAILGLDLLAHDARDSYTHQAMAWRSGSVHLPEDIPYLELAIYEGDYYVSFPPFPTVPMLLLSFFFGEETPNALFVFLCYWASYILAYCIARRYAFRDLSAAAFALFLTLGCNMFAESLFGSVWNQAQVLSFFLTLLALYCVLFLRRFGRAAGLVFIACAVGCRPFQAVFVPFLLFACYQREDGRFSRRIARMLPMLIVPVLIAGTYAWYNFIRFGSVFEFGHNYLPEFTRSETGQFSLGYVMNNLRNILRMPTIENGALSFPSFNGFAFFIANPIFVLAFYRLIYSLIKRQITAGDWIMLSMCGVEFYLLLMHGSFGGWQFGTRYLCDMVPVLYCFILARRKRIDVFEAVLMAFAVAFNLYGTVLFHIWWA